MAIGHQSHYHRTVRQASPALALAVILLALDYSCGTVPRPAHAPVLQVQSLQAEIAARATEQIYQAGDDHIAVVVHNSGRPIRGLVIDLSGGDRWLDHHVLMMGTTPRCMPDLASSTVECGPVAAGATVAIMLRAAPDEVGHYHYSAAFFDSDGQRVEPIADASGRPITINFEENVLPIGRRMGLGVVEESPKPPE